MAQVGIFLVGAALLYQYNNHAPRVKQLKLGCSERVAERAQTFILTMGWQRCDKTLKIHPMREANEYLHQSFEKLDKILSYRL